MSRFRDVQTFVDMANRATSLAEVASLIADAASEIGFDYYSLLHHVDFAVRMPEFVRLSNYPQSWLDRFVDEQFYLDDPMLTACQKTAVGFRWSEVTRLIRMTSRQESILARAVREGLGEGFTVPVHVPGEFTGSASFSVVAGRAMHDDVLPAAQYLGAFGFEAARRIARREAAPRPEPPRLTRRQTDCLLLVAQGKSDWDAGQILGVSPDTVHEHVEAAKKKYGVATRTQLVVRALFDSRIAFVDVV
jgi:LuxR family transcriptional regulator, quorum-sensing system regulator CciR